ncbi:ead/Ea22-like family protein [Escherichia coli]|nr:ead/Ea22-like family protein [Escherichia coli]
MNDITELAQSLKAAARKATPGQWMAFTHADSQTFSVHTPDDKRCGDVIKWAGFDGQRKAKANAEFIALANPANVLALVEALEKAQQQIVELQQGCENDPRIHEIIDLKERIAELESRTVTVKHGEVLVTVAGFTGCGKSAIAGEIEIAMRAIGVPVTWANGDSEKRMTGADWHTAIEMYKPSVRIVEVNIPRATGIKVEAE